MTNDIDPAVVASLSSIYEEIMWLSGRPNTTPSAARAWYTHVAAARMSRYIRRFSGKVSGTAVTDQSVALRLEHFKRIQTTLTQLVHRHVTSGTHDAAEFVQLVLDHEQVHIVTVAENYAAMRAKGNYIEAGIILVDWQEVSPERQRILWKTMLNGKVANALHFSPSRGAA